MTAVHEDAPATNLNVLVRIKGPNNEVKERKIRRLKLISISLLIVFPNFLKSFSITINQVLRPRNNQAVPNK